MSESAPDPIDHIRWAGTRYPLTEDNVVLENYQGEDAYYDHVRLDLEEGRTLHVFEAVPAFRGLYGALRARVGQAPRQEIVPSNVVALFYEYHRDYGIIG